MTSIKERLLKNLDASIAAKLALKQQTSVIAVFDSAVQATINAYRKGYRLYIAGNGGSAADAQHLAAEFVSKLARDRAPLPAEALTTDSSIVTAISNDYGYDQVFSRQLAGKAVAGDVFLGISTSGNSPNIHRALTQCKLMGVQTILFTGREGGTCLDIADYGIVVPGSATSTIQELHIILAHSLCECVESALFED